ncbi:hypothetical protein NDU88_008514 [Pleurodeles waltl]|uniref:Uncharacterized protein n=1 Tax=Pleurodeles waltl TaxID=8319 RepID=A0AAV7RTA7_PLEWA|nr:hypothetical protein NDU88_008514 [Pleurodeles waltl]
MPRPSCPRFTLPPSPVPPSPQSPIARACRTQIQCRRALPAVCRAQCPPSHSPTTTPPPGKGSTTDLGQSQGASSTGPTGSAWLIASHSSLDADSSVRPQPGPSSGLPHSPDHSMARIQGRRPCPAPPAAGQPPRPPPSLQVSISDPGDSPGEAAVTWPGRTSARPASPDPGNGCCCHTSTRTLAILPLLTPRQIGGLFSL